MAKYFQGWFKYQGQGNSMSTQFYDISATAKQPLFMIVSAYKGEGDAPAAGADFLNLANFTKFGVPGLQGKLCYGDQTDKTCRDPSSNVQFY